MLEEQINKSEDKLIQAFKDSDVKVIDELIHDDLIFNGPTGDLINKEMDLSSYRSGNMVVNEMNVLEREVRVFDNTATVSTVVHLKGSFMKNQIDAKVRFFRTWKSFAGEWKVIGGSSIFLNQ